jgi:branched-chain amino acid transport system permease protein
VRQCTIPLGQGAFYGIGAYTAAAFSISFKLPFLLAIIADGSLAGLSSLLLIPIVRLKGSSLARVMNIVGKPSLIAAIRA